VAVGAGGEVLVEVDVVYAVVGSALEVEVEGGCVKRSEWWGARERRVNGSSATEVRDLESGDEGSISVKGGVWVVGEGTERSSCVAVSSVVSDGVS
jgi:hypothetical protein